MDQMFLVKYEIRNPSSTNQQGPDFCGQGNLSHAAEFVVLTRK